VTRLTNELANENAKAEEAKRQPPPMSQAAPSRHVVTLSESDVERIRTRLLQRMAELGINDRVTLDAAYGLGLHRSDTLGQYDTWNKLISIALHKTRTPEHSLNHEAIHALRDLGLFTSEEWSVLVEAAWSDPELRHWATASAAYRDLPLELQQEEAAAEFFAETVEAFNGKAVKGEPLGRFEGMLHRMVYRVVKFLNALRHAVSYLRTGLPGDTRLIDVITRINSGEVGRRKPLVRGNKPTTTFGKRIVERRAQAARGGDDETKGGLFPAGVEERWNDAAKGIGDGAAC
jgi:hypothetical protein